MTTVPAPDDRAEAPLFADGIGERVVVADGATGELLQILRLRPALTAVPSFEFALRERAARLANFRHAYYARVRRIDRVPAPGIGLAIVSDHVEGTRLSDILRVAHDRRLQLDINTAICLIRQLVSAVALLHENAREVAHGLIAPERLLLTPHARLVLVEHVLAAAIEQLQFGRERLWQEFRIALPASAGLARFDHRADVTGMGLVALALLLGRPLGADEFPHRIVDLLNQARERSALGDEQPLSAPMRLWMARALQLDPRRAFASGPEALAALDEIVAEDATYVSAPVALETFLSRFTAALLEPASAEVAPPAVLHVVAPPSDPAPPDTVPTAPRPQHQAASVREPVLAHEAPTYDFTEFHRELERDATLAKVAPVRHVTQHLPLPKRETSSRAGRDARQWEDADSLTWGTHEPSPPATHETPRYTEAPHDALASRWTENAVASPPAGGAAGNIATHPSLDALAPQTDFLPVTARDIEELISTKDLASADEEDELPLPDFAPTGANAGRTGGKRWLRTVALLAVILALAGAGVFASRLYGGRAVPAAPAMGTLLVQSRPAGVQVVVDGVDRGQTPARVSVSAGAHILELRGRGVPRVIPITVAAGAQISQYIEFADTPVTGQLAVESQPPGARVVVDGTDRGIAPLTLSDVSPGEHEVVLQSETGKVRHVVTVQAGATASLVAPLAPSAPAAGWITVKAPFTIEIREQGRTLGTSENERITLSPGRHELELVNGTLGYRATRAVQVVAGKGANLAVDLPQGVVNLNATPWAEVWIDGARVGETPIGNLGVPIGPHEVVFRHPQLGEKRHAISVTLTAPVRVSMDMR